MTTRWWRNVFREDDPPLPDQDWSAFRKPTVRLIPAATLQSDNTEIGASKLGGLPDLPLGTQWPTRPAYSDPRMKRTRRNSRAWTPQALRFLCQINLKDISKLECALPLPSAGLLLFFYDVDFAPGGASPHDAIGTQVLFAEEGTTLRRAESVGVSVPVRRITCIQGESLPSWEWIEELAPERLDFLANASRKQAHNAVDKYYEGAISEGHRFGGWPSQIQNTMELELERELTNPTADHGHRGDVAISQLKRGAKEWRLMLQLDSDDELGWKWGDGGMLYFWCRESDIAEKHFERVYTILQCY